MMVESASTLIAFSLFAVAHAGKRGLTWTWYNGESEYNLNPSVFHTDDGNIVAMYNYETYAPSPSNGGLGFIGMQRCYPTCNSSPVDELYSLWQQQQWATVFSINEADAAGIDPGDAAAWYQQYINPLPIKKAIPSVTDSTQSGQGLEWASAFISACAGHCYYDYINLHWYGPDFPTFQAYIEQAHAKFPGTQLVVTEFALQNPPNGESDQIAFYQQAIPFLDSADYVQLYFPFVATSPQALSDNDSGAVSFVGTSSCLFNDDGSVSSIGGLFI